MNSPVFLTRLRCIQCQHENPLGVSLCEQCQTPLPDDLAPLAEPEKDSTNPPTSPPSIAATDDTGVTVSPQIDAAPTPNHSDRSQTVPPSITLPPLQAEVDPHLPTAAKLQHDTSDEYLPLATDIFVWRIGKPHHGAQPDLDISTFPQSEIVSRSHALIRYHRGQYYIEDMNSSNGTYVNHQSLVPGRHYPLNHNDCIALGKGDLVRFFFQICAS
jgi:hypothetical protein